MANELGLAASLAYADAAGAKAAQFVPQTFVSPAALLLASGEFSAAITDTAIPLGGVANLGWILIINRDPTNFVQVRTAAAGTRFAKIPPGLFALFQFGQDITAPVVIANVAPCKCEYYLISA